MEKKLFGLQLIVIFLAVLGNFVITTAGESTTADKTTATASNATIPTTTPTVSPSPSEVGFGGGNSTQTNDDAGLLHRSLYAAVGLSAVVVIYFIIRTIRTKRRKSKTKKYGVIHGAGDLEMQPLERDDDDEEDVTVFDMNDRRNNK